MTSFQLDPDAEMLGKARDDISPGDEEQFFRQGGAKYALMHHQQHLGWLGKMFGSSGSAPMNIAGLVILLSFCLVVGSFFAPTTAELADVRKVLFGVISSALAFIFGAASKK
jgi:hypothetical protein